MKEKTVEWMNTVFTKKTHLWYLLFLDYAFTIPSTFSSSAPHLPLCLSVAASLQDDFQLPSAFGIHAFV